MQGVHCYELSITTNTAGSADFRPDAQITGEILSIRYPGTALNLGGTADFLLKRDSDGGTILSAQNFTGPWQYQPRDTLHTLTGGSALAAGSNGVPVDGYLKCIVGSATPSVTDKVYIYYRR